MAECLLGLLFLLGNYESTHFEPKLGHITTFGGHPINCAASACNFRHLLTTDIMQEVDKKEQLFRSAFKTPKNQRN